MSFFYTIYITLYTLLFTLSTLHFLLKLGKKRINCKITLTNHYYFTNKE